MIRGSMVALLVGLGVYALIAGFMFFNQRQLLYHPDIKQVDPATLGITGAEVTAITTPDGEKLVAWYAPAPAGRPTVLFLHGNAGSIAERPLRFQYLPQGRLRRPLSVLARLWRIDRPTE